MQWWHVLLLVLLICIALVLLGAYVCFYLVFYAPRRKKRGPDTPAGAVYDPYRAQMRQWIRQVDEMPHERISIQSEDGLTLWASLYEYAPDAPIEIMFHGYRGSARRDLCGGVQRCFALGHSALVVDQRTSGDSGGRVITFGIREKGDCVLWAREVQRRFAGRRQVLLTGISMGAATVLMAAGQPLPPCVVGVLADCGYSTPKDIIVKCIRQLKLPVFPIYPLIALGAQLYGGFSVTADSPVQALARCKLPVLFVHGDDDDFVPCEMSRINYAACPSRKELLVIPGAGHGLAYVLDEQRYVDTMRRFFHGN